MGDGTGNNDNFFRPNAPSSTVGGGGEIPDISAPSTHFHQKMLGMQSRLKHGSHQPIGSYEGASNGVDVGHYLGMRQQMSPAMMMSDNSASFPSSMFANNSDNHYSLHPQFNDFQPEKIQMPQRGRQERGHQQQQRLTRSLPTTLQHDGGLLHDQNSNTHQLSQSLPQFPTVHQSLEALTADVQRQEMVSGQHQNNEFQPEKIQLLPSRGLQEERGRQQRLTRSLPNTAHYEHNNVGWLHRSNTDPLSRSLPQSQVGQQSLEALRADVQRQELELEQLTKQAGNYSSSVPSSTIHPSSTSLFSSQLQKQPTRLPSDQLFHREDPLGFFFNDTTDDDKKSPFAPAPMNWQQQNLQQPEQVATSSNNNLAQASREADRKPIFPSPLSQSKRRRLDSDQIDRMMHMFLSDSIIESPGDFAGNDLLAPAATSTLDDAVDSAIPDLPLRDDGNVSMNSESEGDDDESTKLLVSDDKKSDPDTKDATPKDTSNHIVTPSTATIAKLTAEIRSQAMKQDEQKKEERASSPSNETQDSSSSASEPNQDKPTISTTIVARLAEIMEASQTSQQNIHDWDRKMGLKRAHSKTMRESCRSRKKVLDLLKAAIDEGKESLLSTLPTVQENSASVETTASVETDDSDVMTTVQEGDQESLSSSTSHSSGEKDEEVSSSASHSSGDKDEEDQDMDMSIAEGVKDVDDDELALMFRRASLECAEGITGEEASIVLQRTRQTSSDSSASCSDKSSADNPETLISMMPQPEETDRVVYHARCA
jgi:hypothetical protein